MKHASERSKHSASIYYKAVAPVEDVRRRVDLCDRSCGRKATQLKSVYRANLHMNRLFFNKHELFHTKIDLFPSLLESGFYFFPPAAGKIFQHVINKPL